MLHALPAGLKASAGATKPTSVGWNCAASIWPLH